MIRAGNVREVKRGNVPWVFVDIGFASSRNTCGFLFDDGYADGSPEELRFSDAVVKRLMPLTH